MIGRTAAWVGMTVMGREWARDTGSPGHSGCQREVGLLRCAGPPVVLDGHRLQGAQAGETPPEPLGPRPVERPAQHGRARPVDQSAGDDDEPLSHGASHDALVDRGGLAERHGPADEVVGD
jgi:hypothetical protein